VATVCSEIYDEVRKLAPHFTGKNVSLRVNPEVARALQGEEAPVLRELCGMLGHEVVVKADPLLHQEQFDVVPQ
jgi:ribonuclease G